MTQPTDIHPVRPAGGVKLHIPNALVVARLILASATFTMLALYRFPDTNLWALPAATALFITAALTDFLDGFLARRWNAVTTFGRIMDPFADKILVLGTVIMLAGANFALPATEHDNSLAGTSASGMQAWMVIIILARELLVTSLRAVAESRGIDFSASLPGKIKMIAQSIGIPLILLTTAFMAHTLDNPDRVRTAHQANVIVALSMTLLTAASALPYIMRAVFAFGHDRGART